MLWAGNYVGGWRWDRGRGGGGCECACVVGWRGVALRVRRQERKWRGGERDFEKRLIYAAVGGRMSGPSKGIKLLRHS